MYSMPQHAVTNGYWKIEYFLAQPMASSRRLVKNEALSVPSIPLPLQSAVIPRVKEAYHQDSEKDAHFYQTRRSQGAIDDSPGI